VGGKGSASFNAKKNLHLTTGGAGKKEGKIYVNEGEIWKTGGGGGKELCRLNFKKKNAVLVGGKKGGSLKKKPVTYSTRKRGSGNWSRK